MATFPNAIKTWVAKKNRSDDVDASHVNALQDEVTAIQTTLGANPQLDLTLNGKRNDYKTVGARLDAIARGLDKPFVRLDSAAETIQSSGDVTTVNFDSPNAIDDPFGMFNGLGFTIKRSGYYSLTTDVRWPNAYSGYRYLGLFVGSVEVAADTRTAVLPGAVGASVRQSVAWQGRLNAGAKVTTRLYQNSGGRLSGTGVTLSGSFQRDVS